MKNIANKSLYGVISYTIAISLLAAAGFTGLVANIPEFENQPIPGSDHPERHIFLLTVIMMFSAGVIGGCLYNFRGIIKHTAEGTYDNKYTITYILRPLSGGVSGLVVFFILLGGALSLNIGAGGGSEGWMTFSGRMPYIAFSIIAGFASQEFMMKLKDLAKSFFATNEGDSGKKSSGR
jgi:hypothetical protein